MKLSKTLSALLIAALLIIAAASSCFASKAEEMLKSADMAVERAQRMKHSTSRDESYKDAEDLYNKVISDYSNSVEAAEAFLALGKLQTNAVGKYKNNYTAYETFKQLINTFDKDKSVLEQKLTSDEATQVLKIVEQAGLEKNKVAAELNEANSHLFQYKILDFFVGLTGRIPWLSYWLAIIILTILVKLAITPLTKAQFKAMKEMQKVAPLIKELQDKYKGDQKVIGEKTMELYKEHKISPFASCLPLLIQMPILMGLYYTIKSYEFQFAHGQFLWIGSSFSHHFSVTMPLSKGTILWLTAGNMAEPDLILLVLYLISMFISTKLSNVDPSQAEQQKMMGIVMPIMFAFLFASFPSAFLLYWLVFNILQTVQQYHIMNSKDDDKGVITAPAISTNNKSKGK